MPEPMLRRVSDDTADCFDARERAVLRLANQIAMTNMSGQLDQPLMTN